VRVQHVLGDLAVRPEFFWRLLDQLASLLALDGRLNPWLAPEQKEADRVEGDDDGVVVVRDRSLDQEPLALKRSRLDEEKAAPQLLVERNAVCPNPDRYGANLLDHAMAPASICSTICKACILYNGYEQFTNEKADQPICFFIWCARKDLNLHARRH
jgi:hypothetical protein